MPHSSVNMTEPCGKRENFFIFCLKIPKQDFQTENKKVNAPLAMGVVSHGEASILGIFTARTARVSLVVMDSENGLNDRPS